MMCSVRVFEPGPLTTIQDKGRRRFQRFGMPVAGAMDLFSYRVANLLVGNDEGAAVIEFTLQGPKLEFLEDSIIAVTGAEVVPLLDNQPMPLWQSVFVGKGSIVSFQPFKSGLRGYLAISGGIKIPQVMGSTATYLRAQIGGLEGRKIIAGDIIPVEEALAKEAIKDGRYRRLPNNLIPAYKNTEEIMVTLGPQDDMFKDESIKTFLTSEYQITVQSDRMGYRLKGPNIEHLDKADIISDGIPPGAIQVPGDGQPIILLADRQTVGGYTKIATVISTDLNKLAQLTPGSKVTFKAVTLDEAYEALEAQESIISQVEELAISIASRKAYKLRIDGREYTVSV
ncbi:MAG: biotin-dependent carboxyltransferase family protein, partial [Bacillota bacterium]|nr:biotin-dependent carboxyltransferase family protein [Bacillota bacterium]